MDPSKDILHSPQAAQLLKNREQLAGLLRSPETQRLMQLLQKGGGDLQGAARAAMDGNTTQLMGMVQQVMNSPEGAKTIEDLNRHIPK
jgi:hypothetical protein